MLRICIENSELKTVKNLNLKIKLIKLINFFETSLDRFINNEKKSLMLNGLV
jgi:hypothetical protein